MCTRPCSLCQGQTPLGEGQGLSDYLRPARKSLLGPGTPSCLAHGTGPTLQLAWKHLKNVASCPPGTWTPCAIPHWLFSVYIISLGPSPGLLPPSGHHLALTRSSDSGHDLQQKGQLATGILGPTRFYLLLGSMFKAEFGLHSIKLPGHDLRVPGPLPLVVTMTSPTLQ